MSYKLLPFRFERYSDSEVFITNEVGEFTFISRNDFEKLTSFNLKPQDETFLNLKAKQIITDTDIEPMIEMLATKYRTKKGSLNNFTALHMVVPTLRCNSDCRYCQVSRKDVTAENCDMDKTTAKKVVNTIFKSHSPYIKIEFQGGEPLLNFKIVKYIVEYAEWRNLFKKKQLEFVICTNLTLITEDILEFLKKHHVSISTSLDGPKDLHNKNRPLQVTDNTYDIGPQGPAGIPSSIIVKSAADEYLGTLTTLGNPWVIFFIQSIKSFMFVDANGYNTYNGNTFDSVRYTEPGCNGDAYAQSSPTGTTCFFVFTINIGVDQVKHFLLSGQPKPILFYSYRQPLAPYSCMEIPGGEAGTVAPLAEVALPFAYPVAVPLSFE